MSRNSTTRPHIAPGAGRPIYRRSASRHVARRISAITPASALTFVFVALVLVVVLPLLLIDTVKVNGTDNTWFATLIIAIWAGLRVSVLIARGRPELFNFFLWLFVYVFFGLAATVQLRSQSFPSTTPDPPLAYASGAAMIVIVGLIAWEIGRFIAQRQDASRENDELRRAPSGPVTVQAEPEIRVFAVVVMAAISLLAAVYFLGSMGPSSVLLTRDNFGALKNARWPDLATSSIIFALAAYLPSLTSHGLFAIHRDSRFRYRNAALLLGLLLTFLALAIANPISNARYVAGTVIVSALVLFGAFNSIARTRGTMTLAVAGLFVIFPIMDVFRRAQAYVKWEGSFEEYKGGDYDAFCQIMNAIAYTTERGYSYGAQAVGSLFFWVPRSIWPSKPVDTGILLANFRGYPFTNLSAPLWAEAWINGGILLLVGVFGVLGWFLTRCDRRMADALLRRDGSYWSIVAALLPIYMFIILRGSLLQATGGLAVILVGTLVMRRVHRGSTVRRNKEFSTR